MRQIIHLLALSLFVAIVGCGDGDVACTLEARSSVTVILENMDGEAVTDADLTYSVNGGEFKDCETYESGEYVCGFEESGDITVRATHDGYTSDVEETVTVELTEDECHVISETVTLTII